VAAETASLRFSFEEEWGGIESIFILLLKTLQRNLQDLR
jgi:hypothetical protein